MSNSQRHTFGSWPTMSWARNNLSFARLLASHIGEFVSCDEAMMFGVDKALCFRVYIDVSKPLRCGVNVVILDQPTWISSRSLDSLIFSMVVVDSGISQGVLIPSMQAKVTRTSSMGLSYKFAINFLSCSFHHIDVSVQREGPSNIWRFSDIYGWPETQQKYRLVLALSRCLCSCVTHVDFDIPLAHSPKCSPVALDCGLRKRRFHFENMWFTEPSCHEVVLFAWGSTTKTDTVDNLLSKLNRCTVELCKWNAHTFGYVGNEIRKLEHQLRNHSDTIIGRQILGQIHNGTKKEEIPWWQRAHSDYLKYGDATTRWFHSRGSMRREKNTVFGRCNDSRTWRRKRDEIADIATKSYRMLINDTSRNNGSPSSAKKDLWRCIWMSDIPPHIKLFSWPACKGIIPSTLNISRSIPGFAISCSICGHAEESDIHAILECPLTVHIWDSSPFDETFMWKCWNARNSFVFNKRDKNLIILSKRAIDFVKGYREHRTTEPLATPSPTQVPGSLMQMDVSNLILTEIGRVILNGMGLCHKESYGRHHIRWDKAWTWIRKSLGRGSPLLPPWS
ncbi:LOW QUALITY PROTEIN: hypothetical protein Cgig2_003254 [Carnegiea gigantea]|uniref:Reverse transcriptase zinc-binding domain-containing protein n=1 Tax=Carnegiea gigantea TaxID=171969 RepID=A0A9Q1Q823_9CARY|nr:LOW QUALITY PROTEIN: hypothetical protein Cgig2_003254 [Carnegiea gigantea]